MYLFLGRISKSFSRSSSKSKERRERREEILVTRSLSIFPTTLIETLGSLRSSPFSSDSLEGICLDMLVMLLL